MNTARRFLRFNAVGALGIGVQLGTIWALTDMAGVSFVPATIAGVSLALAHNFCWHLKWTWRDRLLTGSRAVQACLSFVAANGVVSFGGNIVIMIALVAGAGVPVLLANLMAIAMCGLVNFWLGDALVFSPSASRTSIPTTSR
jgi:dolichol-phosphate mannosyltransferase